jgi:hypothetical protein
VPPLSISNLLGIIVIIAIIMKKNIEIGKGALGYSHAASRRHHKPFSLNPTRIYSVVTGEVFSPSEN